VLVCEQIVGEPIGSALAGKTLEIGFAQPVVRRGAEYRRV
jgi:hypothetical protein